MNDQEWAAAFKCKKALLPITYLGMSLGERPSKAFWKRVLQRVEKRLALWKRKFLSKCGRLVLIKAVLSSIPTYFMSVFKMSTSVALAIEKCQRSFFWGDGVEKRKVHAIDCKTMCSGKRNDRLGIGMMADKNNGMLAKWVWRYGKENNTMWKRVICSKYGTEF
ncbi:hypothetical protein Ddye_028138 [Dipteronia dyeriana]|uniref:Uncharacterized protein n=1 Tax=Dipteronia dyeriana TaxID=168575 RepID=A0AAD9TRB0_9ROSI|nr:hypothetical protein Ddye_028138 [Dipteronia dyeriana]